MVVCGLRIERIPPHEWDSNCVRERNIVSLLSKKQGGAPPNWFMKWETPPGLVSMHESRGSPIVCLLSSPILWPHFWCPHWGGLWKNLQWHICLSLIVFDCELVIIVTHSVLNYFVWSYVPRLLQVHQGRLTWIEKCWTKKLRIPSLCPKPKRRVKQVNWSLGL